MKKLFILALFVVSPVCYSQNNLHTTDKLDYRIYHCEEYILKLQHKLEKEYWMMSANSKQKLRTEIISTYKELTMLQKLKIIQLEKAQK